MATTMRLFGEAFIFGAYRAACNSTQVARKSVRNPHPMGFALTDRSPRMHIGGGFPDSEHAKREVSGSFTLRLWLFLSAIGVACAPDKIWGATLYDQ
jgi:hypothetical protein